MPARLQVLQLPASPDGEDRYALVMDQAADLSDPDRSALRAFASELGAQGCLVVSGVIDVVQDAGEADEELAQGLAQLLKPTVAPQPAPQAPKLPPPNTTEGKLARSWQGQARLKKQQQGDPQS